MLKLSWVTLVPSVWFQESFKLAIYRGTIPRHPASYRLRVSSQNVSPRLPPVFALCLRHVLGLGHHPCGRACGTKWSKLRTLSRKDNDEEDYCTLTQL